MKDFEDLTIAVLGAGYVGSSIANLLSQNYDVIVVDILLAMVVIVSPKIQNSYSLIMKMFLKT